MKYDLHIRVEMPTEKTDILIKKDMDFQTAKNYIYGVMSAMPNIYTSMNIVITPSQKGA